MKSYLKNLLVLLLALAPMFAQGSQLEQTIRFSLQGEKLVATKSETKETALDINPPADIPKTCLEILQTRTLYGNDSIECPREASSIHWFDWENLRINTTTTIGEKYVVTAAQGRINFSTIPLTSADKPSKGLLKEVLIDAPLIIFFLIAAMNALSRQKRAYITALYGIVLVAGLAAWSDHSLLAILCIFAIVLTGMFSQQLLLALGGATIVILTAFGVGMIENGGEYIAFIAGSAFFVFMIREVIALPLPIKPEPDQ